MKDISPNRVQSIIARAATLWDREIRESDNNLKNEDLVTKRLNRWIFLLGSEQLLHRRLQCTQISPSSLPSLLTPESENIVSEPWHKSLQEIIFHIESLQSNLTTYSDDVFEASNPLPFEEAFLPLINYYRKEINDRCKEWTFLITDKAKIKVERQLLSHLCFITGKSLGKTFYEFRLSCAQGAAFEHIWINQPRSYSIYNSFITYLLKGGFIEYMDKYPVMARMICQSIEQFILVITEFLTRYSQDFAELNQTYAWKQISKELSITDLQLFLSDRHYGGKTVIECHLKSGNSIIYKPRNANPEIAYYQFLSELNALLPDLRNKIIKIVGKDGYAWVQRIVPAICTSEADVHAFYKRMGALLAISHALALTDVHFENLIACGAYPVIVDLETLLDEVLLTDKYKSIQSKDNVLRTGLLPQWQHDAEGKKIDFSGIGADEMQDAGIKLSKWEAINSDQMHLVDDTRTMMMLQHRPCVNNEYPSPIYFLDQLLLGFKECYLCLYKNVDLLISNEKLMTAFDGLELRTIVRDTNTYTALQLHLLHPEFLENGIDRSIELEWLARPLMGTKKPNPNRMRVYEVERSAMELMDVPHFHSGLDWTEEPSNDEDLHFLKRKRDSNILKKRLKRLSKEDLKIQSDFIIKVMVERFAQELKMPLQAQIDH